jgi:hypothetical protein
MATLLDCLGSSLDEKSIQGKLKESGLPKDLASELSMDLRRHEYRASISIETSASQTNGQRFPNASSSLLLLKGMKRDWLFTFPLIEKNDDGQVVIARSGNLQEQFASMLMDGS